MCMYTNFTYIVNDPFPCENAGFVFARPQCYELIAALYINIILHAFNCVSVEPCRHLLVNPKSLKLNQI